MSILGFFFIVFLIIYILSVTSRYWLPFVMQRLMKRMMKNMGGDMSNSDHNQKKEGEISMKQVSDKKKRTDSDMGDYIDFEEVD